MDAGLGVWVRARKESDLRDYKADRKRVAAAAKPPRLTKRQNVVFWAGFTALLVAGFVIGAG